MGARHQGPGPRPPGLCPEEHVLRPANWQASQKQYYDERDHAYLGPGRGGRYAASLVDRVWEILRSDSDAHGLEVGCGSGRFTLPLLARCRSLEAVDLSSRHLDLLGQELAARGIGDDRCVRHQANVEQIDEVLPHGRFDFLVGFHILHHLEDVGDTLRRLRQLLRPGGCAAFVEPNRRNPFYPVQILFTPDMRFSEERRMFQLGGRGLRRMMGDAGFAGSQVQRRGLFPPFLVNRFESAAVLERRVERLRWARPVLPLVIASGTRPA